MSVIERAVRCILVHKDIFSLKVFNIYQFTDEGRWLYVFGLLVVYGMAHIPQIYLFSYVFKTPASGFAALVGWNVLSSKF